MTNLVPETALWRLEDEINNLEQQNEMLSNEVQELSVINDVYFANLVELGVNPNDLTED